MKYQVEITEMLQHVIEVDAENELEAERAVRQSYRNGEVVFGAEDFISAEFAPVCECKSVWSGQN